MKARFLLAVIIIFASVARAQDYKVLKDICYCPDGDGYQKERCKLDFYYPEGVKDFPVVVWFHGGGLVEGNKFIPEKLKEKGIGIVAANYRLMPNVHISKCYDDAAHAVAWAMKECIKYGADPKRIFVSGHSAGATLTDMIILDKSYLGKYGIDADDIAGCFPLSGQVIAHYNYRKFQYGLSPLQGLIDEYSPAYHVRLLKHPMVIISGDRELELYGRYEETAWFWRMMQLAGNGKLARIYELDGYDHGGMPEPAYDIMVRYIKAICDNKEIER